MAAMAALEQHFKDIATLLALAIEAAAVLVVAFGALQALARILGVALRAVPDLRAAKAIWLGFAAWIVLSLEFALAADIIRTAIAPTWKDIGQLAAIATIRTALNYYLEKDIDEVAAKTEQTGRAPAA
jgi:uncharacterized membrane protein